jgi:putative hydrolase of the HAD superfamily
MSPFDWIFFDCFNTLIDDFDSSGDESGLGPIKNMPLQPGWYSHPVEAGWYSEAEEFLQDWDDWHKTQWPARGWREVALPDRLRSIFRKRLQDRDKEVEVLVSMMVSEFANSYPNTLRFTPGVREMLDFWRGRCRMGVVSNFYLPGWPARCIEEFGLSPYFEFVLDSSAFGWKKPGHQIYEEALRLSGILRSEVNRVVFIGDSLRNDVLAPRQIGMQSIYFDRSGDRPSSSRTPEGILSITHWDQFRLHLTKT